MATPVRNYPLPRNDRDFERLVLRLLRRHWQLPQLERLGDGDRGEGAIHLLEISGRARLAAVRCELKPPEAVVETAAVRDAAAQAASTKLPIGRFVVATTALRPAGFQRSLIALNRALRPGGISSIEVLTWEDIEELLDEYPQLATETSSTAKRQALTLADSRVRLAPASATASDDEAADPAAQEIRAATDEIDAGRCQFARFRLLRIREQRWSELTPHHKSCVLTGLAQASLKEGDQRRAAMLLIAAKSLEPDEEVACTNEALAHEILGEHDRAYALADRLRMQFPSSARALALWLNNAPASVDIRTLEEGIAPEFASHGEVAIVMARAALARGTNECAERYARSATTTTPDRSAGWLALGQAILLDEISAQFAAGGASSEDDSRVREAESCFTQAVALAQSEASTAAEVQGLIGRAQARIALRDTEGAGRDIEDAHGLEREDANGLCEYGIVLRSRGNLGEAIAVFRRAVAVGGRDDAEYHLAVSLRERDNPGDLHEAADLLVRSIARPGAVPEGDFAFAVGCAIEALTTLERWPDAEALLNALPSGSIPAVTTYTLRAGLMRSQSRFEEASRLADEAIASIVSDTTADNLRQLAALLNDLARYPDALPLWQSLSPAGSIGADTRRLLDCASRLGRDDIVLELSRALHPEDAAGDGIGTQLATLERNDPENALTLLNDYLAEHPGDATFRLRRSLVARRLQRTDQVISDPNSMPPPREIPLELARGAIEIMREGGRAAEALAYAYELLRRRPAEVDAHRAYLAALGPIGPAPHVGDFDAAGPGAAVCFEQESNGDRWVVLEDSADPDESRDEFGPSAPMARALKGKRAGDRFQLPEGRFSRKAGVVKQIVSKYAWRYQDCLANWSARFPGTPEVETAVTPPETIDWAVVEAECGAAVDASSNGKREDALRAAERAYVENTLPLHAVAERLGLNDLQTVFILAQRPDATIKCCLGTRDELDAALDAFAHANLVVIDLSAIATLCLLGRLGLLATWPRQFVVSQTTVAELRRLALQDSLMRLPPGFSASVNGSGADSKRIDVQLKALPDALQSVCRVRDGAILSALDQDRRERMVRQFGRHGAESIAIASMPGHVLWTDDRLLAEFARAEFGVRRAWTESALKARAQAGILDPAELATASTKLAGWGYAFTAPSVEMLLRAGTVAQWNPEQFPLRQALEQFSSEAMDFNDALRMAAELIVRIYNEAGARSARRTVTMRLLDKIAVRAGGRGAIEGLPRSLPIRFGMDLIHARELNDVVRGWAAQQGDLALSA